MKLIDYSLFNIKSSPPIVFLFDDARISRRGGLFIYIDNSHLRLYYRFCEIDLRKNEKIIKQFNRYSSIYIDWKKTDNPIIVPAFVNRF